MEETAHLLNKTLFLFSPEPWLGNFVSKHHYAKSFAERGVQVYFFNPPCTGYTFKVFSCKKIRQNISLVEYRVQKGLNAVPLTLRKHILRKNAAVLIQYLSAKPDVILSFDPYVFQDLSVFTSPLTKIFFMVDLVKNRMSVETARSGDVVLCTSQVIKSYFEENSITSINIGHGVDEIFFTDDHNSLERNGKLKIGYSGNLDIKSLDLLTLLKIVEENNSLEFHFAGNDLQVKSDVVSSLERFDNVFIHGRLQLVELAEMLQNMDILLLCYDTSRYRSEVSNPHKVLEYLATGKPIVSSYTAEYENTNLLEMVVDNAELPSKLRYVVSNYDKLMSEELVEKRQDYARERTYSKNLERIEKLLDQR